MAIDSPIQSRTEDRLGRVGFADSIAVALRRLDPSRGAVVGLYGPWGVGKTSLLNMVKESLEAGDPRLKMVDFNPWLFSGAEQLVLRFFDELAAEFRDKPGRLGKLADDLIEYGQLVGPLQYVPVAGPWFARGAKIAVSLKRLRESQRHTSVQEQRAEIETQLAALPSPIVVAIDDIDRLEPQEVRNVLQLVRLTASFPNVIYVLAFDRIRVERVLENEGFEGRAYLEKIIELPFDIPLVPESQLSRVLLDELDTQLADLQAGPFDQAQWIEMFYRGIRPLFSNLRDVSRYIAAIPSSLPILGEEVALVDALALEAMRLLEPESHAHLWVAADPLTETKQSSTERGSNAINALIEAASEEHAKPITEMVRLLFPAAERHLGGMSYGPEYEGAWRRDRRVASREVLSFYLNRILAPGVAPAILVESAFDSLGDEAALRRLLSDLGNDVLEDLFERLEAYEEDFSSEVAEPATAVLLEAIPRLRTEERGMFDFGPEFKVTRVVLRLLSKVDDQTKLSAIVDRLLERSLPMFSQMELVDLVGHEPDVGQELVPRVDANRMHSEVCRRVRHAPASLLLGERHVLELVRRAIEDDPSDLDDLARSLESEDLRFALLRDSVTEVRSQAVGELATRRERRLAWDTLCDVLGSESAVSDLVGLLERRKRLDEGTQESIQLAKRYLGGWRPERPPSGFASRITRFSPDAFLSPPYIWPDLVMRTVGAFDFSSSRTSELSIDPDLRRRFTTSLDEGGLERAYEMLRSRLGGDDGPATWDWENRQTTTFALSTLFDRSSKSHQLVQIRCGLLLADSQSPLVRVVTDVYLSISQGQSDAKATAPLLSLFDVVGLLAVSLRSSTRTIPQACFPDLFQNISSHQPVMEVHLAAGRGTTDGIPSHRRLSDTIDLSLLGRGTTDPPTGGGFAASSNQLLRSSRQFEGFVIDGLHRMALDWGFIEPEDALRSLEGSSSEW